MNRVGLRCSVFMFYVLCFYVFMFFFSETDIIEPKKYEKRIQTSVDNTVNNEIKFDICVKDKKNFF